MSEKVREFWIGKSISGWTAVESLKAYGIIAPNQETTIHVIEKSAYDRLTEINKLLSKALEFYGKHHHHMNTTAPNFALEALAKAKEMGK